MAGKVSHGGRDHIYYSATTDRQHWFGRDTSFDMLPEDEFARAKEEWRRTALPRRRTVGALILREDGWAELRPTGDQGRVVTRQFVFEGSQLHLNADASGGSIRVEVLDPVLRPYDGFSIHDCYPLELTAPDQIWREGRVPSLIGSQRPRARAMAQVQSPLPPALRREERRPQVPPPTVADTPNREHFPGP